MLLLLYLCEAQSVHGHVLFSVCTHVLSAWTFLPSYIFLPSKLFLSHQSLLSPFQKSRREDCLFLLHDIFTPWTCHGSWHALSKYSCSLPHLPYCRLFKDRNLVLHIFVSVVLKTVYYCWDYWCKCIKCLLELLDLVMFTENVDFGLHHDNSILMPILNVEIKFKSFYIW